MNFLFINTDSVFKTHLDKYRIDPDDENKEVDLEDEQDKRSFGGHQCNLLDKNKCCLFVFNIQKIKKKTKKKEKRWNKTENWGVKME